MRQDCVDRVTVLQAQQAVDCYVSVKGAPPREWGDVLGASACGLGRVPVDTTGEPLGLSRGANGEVRVTDSGGNLGPGWFACQFGRTGLPGFGGLALGVLLAVVASWRRSKWLALLAGVAFVAGMAVFVLVSPD